MKYYKLTLEDFKRVFEFGANYYLDPLKNTTGRTSAEPRGLGAILDSFTLGKLTEIGIEKILTELSDQKRYVLDFDIKSNSKVQNEPDIISIIDRNINRNPNIFIEIKNTSQADRWIGLTEEQFNTILRNANSRKIYMIYASLRCNTLNKNPKTADLTGMFLKEIEDKNKSQIFQKFVDLNAECRVEFIISSDDLKKFSYPFEKGMNMYETNLFDEKKFSSFYSKQGTRKDIQGIKEFINYNSEIEIEISKNSKAENKKISIFNVRGSFKLISKNKKTFIECISDVFLENEIFGEFFLSKDKFYSFNLSTVGRDPLLKRNNFFISKRRVFQLIKNNKIPKPENVILDIIKNI